MNNFWQNTEKPLACLAPMEDATDTAFREIVLLLSEPSYLHILFTEFTSTDGLMHEKGYLNVVKRLKVNDSERKLLKEKDVKIVAQIWGANPEKYYRTARLLADSFDFDGIDINMGCPVRKIVKHGSCAALIKNPVLAGEIVQATKEGSNVPVSVKTRIGYLRPDTDNWIGFLLTLGLDALIIHGRTQKMQSEGLADWGAVARSVEMRDAAGINTVIIGNGDVMSMEDGRLKAETAKCEGFMVGRGIFHDPWLFRKEPYTPDISEKVDTLLKHTRLFHQTWEGQRNFALMKRFFKIYIQGFPGAHDLRARLMECNKLEEVEDTLRGSHE